MKKIIFTICFTILTISLFAQPTKDEINYIQSTWGMQKRDIIQEQMKLSGTDSAAFWSVYDKYEDSRKELGRERINTLVDYGQNYQTLSDVKVDELIMKMFSNNTKFLELLNITYAQMKAVISPLKAAQFIQVESYLDNELKSQILGEIPIIGTLDKQKPGKNK